MDQCWPSIKQQLRLENLQKRCLRTIYGYEKGYDELLIEADLKTLEERREKALLKFARKTAKKTSVCGLVPEE